MTEAERIELELIERELARRGEVTPLSTAKVSIEREEKTNLEKVRNAALGLKEWALRPVRDVAAPPELPTVFGASMPLRPRLDRLPSPSQVSLEPKWTGGAGRSFAPPHPLTGEGYTGGWKRSAAEFVVGAEPPTREEELEQVSVGPMVGGEAEPTNLIPELAITATGVGMAARTGMRGFALAKEALDYELAGALSLKRLAAMKLNKIIGALGTKKIEAMRPVELYKTVAEEAPDLAKTVHGGLTKFASKLGIKGAEKMESVALDQSIKVARLKTLRGKTVKGEYVPEAVKDIEKGAKVSAERIGKKYVPELATKAEKEMARNVDDLVAEVTSPPPVSMKPITTYDEYIAAGKKVTKGKYVKPTEKTIIGQPTLDKMDAMSQEALETHEIIKGAPKDTKLYGGMPGFGELYDEITSHVSKPMSRLVQHLRHSFASSHNISSEPAWVESFNAWAKGETLKNRTAARLLHDYKGDTFSATASERIGATLENPGLYGALTKDMQRQVDWYKKMYKTTMEMFIRKNVGSDAEYKLVSFLGDQYREGFKGAREFVPKVVQKEWNLSDDAMHALEVARRKVDNYLPHVFDKEVLITAFEDEQLALEVALRYGKATKAKDAKLGEVKKLLEQLKGSKLVLWKNVPKEVQNRHYLIRKGKEGYGLDANAAFMSHFNGWLQEMYVKPTMRVFNGNYAAMSPGVQKYAKAFMQDYLGLSGRSQVWSSIRSAEWVRTMGLNPSSAFNNALQQINTIVDAGPIWSAKGYLRAVSPEGRKMFAMSGAKDESARVMFYGKTSKGLEKARRVSGKLFTTVEEGLRSHALNTFFLKARDGLGYSYEDAWWYGISGMYRTQFRYGMDMPRITRGGAWGVATQFSSFSIKSIEFFFDLWKSPGGRKKALAWLGAMEGGRYTVRELLDIDLSNQLGIGANYGEAMKAMEKFSEKEWRTGWLHAKASVGYGTGIMPTGPGPFVQLVASMRELFSNPDAVKRELTPVAYNKGRQFVEALADGRGDAYPIYNTVGLVGYSWKSKEKLYELTLGDLMLRTFGPKPSAEVDERIKAYKHRMAGEMRNDLNRVIKEAMLNGDSDTINTVMGKYGYIGIGFPDARETQSARERRALPRAERLRREFGADRRAYEAIK